MPKSKMTYSTWLFIWNPIQLLVGAGIICWVPKFDNWQYWNTIFFTKSDSFSPWLSYFTISKVKIVSISDIQIFASCWNITSKAVVSSMQVSKRPMFERNPTNECSKRQLGTSNSNNFSQITDHNALNKSHCVPEF